MDTDSVYTEQAAIPGLRSGERTLWQRVAITRSARRAVTSALPPGSLTRAMAVLELAIGGATVGTRTAPSAGGIYPYEYFLLLRDTAQKVTLHRIDPATRSVVPLRAGAALEAGLEPAGLTLCQDEAALILAARPWLSMRKYGDHGYLYTHLDTSHAAVAAALAAESCGLRYEIRRSIRGAGLRAFIGPAMDCREPHSTVIFTLPRFGRPTEPWRVLDDRSGEGAHTSAHWLELANWDSLALVDAAGPKTADHCEMQSMLSSARRQSERVPTDPTEWTAPVASKPVPAEVIRGRRSATCFADGPIALPDLQTVLDRAHSGLVTDVPQAELPALTLILADRAGAVDAAAGSDAFGRPEFGLRPGWARVRRAGLDDPAYVVPAFMAQEHLYNAAAVALIHANVRVLSDRDSELMRETVFRAGSLGHLLCLGAAEAGLGATAVGGFDAAVWRRLGDLPAGQEVVYLIAFGQAAVGGPKIDRAEPAHA
jgi:nitroreductase